MANIVRNLKSLINTGYREFRRKYTYSPSILDDLSRGQAPQTMFVACCDSRVDPAILLQCDPGDIFVTRSIAAIVPHASSTSKSDSVVAALKFAVCYLEVKDLVILGHSNCAGVQNLLFNIDDQNISKWLANISKKLFSGTDLDTCTQEALIQAKQNCLSYDWLRARQESGQLNLHTWFFDIKSGDLLAFDPEHNNFKRLQLPKRSTILAE